MANPKVFVAEFLGTFTLVLVGAAAGIYSGISSLGVGLLGVALAHGLTLAVLAYVYGNISGAHVNPAVTLGLAANGNIKWLDAAVYWVAQLSGAALAAFLLKTFLTLVNADLANGMATHGVLTADHPYYAMTLEAILTFFLVSTVLHTAVGGKAGQMAGWAIGTTLTIGILVGGPLTGGSLNPARSFGPAIFTQAIKTGTPDYQNPLLYLIYFVGPFIGAILAVLIYQFFIMEFASAEEVDEEDEVEVEVVEVVVEEPVKKSARKSTKK